MSNKAIRTVEETMVSIDERMRKRPEWMTRSDDEILEYLKDEGAGTPKVIGEALDRNNDYISQRCSKLVTAGFLERPSRGFYILSKQGEDYLSGNFDGSDIPEP